MLCSEGGHLECRIVLVDIMCGRDAFLKFIIIIFFFGKEFVLFQWLLFYLLFDDGMQNGKD